MTCKIMHKGDTGQLYIRKSRPLLPVAAVACACRMFCWTDCHIPLFSETPEGCQAKPRTSTPIFSLNAISR